MTLYLKYRPQKIEDLDLENVREQLKKIVASKTLPHAFLFSGPKGAGKTSAARILAKIINCKDLGDDNEPCGKCQSCIEIEKGTNLDVIEIDAASNRGIDDVRALKESIMLAPSSSQKKIYIVDEAHMLTTEASNAFLKTLEEPPDHAVFILATTDPQKLPETVRSRLVNVNFRKASDAEIARQIGRVAKGEKVSIDDKAMARISKAADGSFRDAVKIFEQLVILEGDKIEVGMVEKFLMSGKTFDVTSFLEIIKKKDLDKALDNIHKMMIEGLSARNIIDSLIDKTREAILEPNMVHFIELLLEARSRAKESPISELPLEIALVKFCALRPLMSEAENERNVDVPETKTSEAELEQKESVSDQHNPEQVEKATKESEEKEPEKVIKKVEEKLPEVKYDEKNMTKIDGALWKEIMIKSKVKNTSVEALLRAAEPLGFDGKYLRLGIYYKFHKERLEIPQNKIVIEEVATSILGSNVTVTYELVEKKFTPPADKPLTPANDKDIISAAKEIFGN